MKKILIILLVLSSMFFSCEDDENIVVTPEKGTYHLEDDPSDYVKHYIYEFYQKYGSVFIVNPKVQDYKYNFVTEVKPIFIAPQQDEEIIKSGFELFDEIFLSKYDEEFKKNFLPFTLHLVDTMKYYTGRKWTYYDTYTSYGFMAISHINADTKDLTEGEKKDMEREINIDFWHKYIFGARKAVELPISFYEVSSDCYDEKVDPQAESPDDLQDIMLDEGFLGYPKSSSYKYAYYPDEQEDLLNFITALITMPKAELTDILDNYPKVKAKYEILKKEVKANLNYDIDNMPLVENIN